MTPRYPDDFKCSMALNEAIGKLRDVIIYLSDRKMMEPQKEVYSIVGRLADISREAMEYEQSILRRQGRLIAPEIKFRDRPMPKQMAEYEKRREAMTREKRQLPDWYYNGSAGSDADLNKELPPPIWRR